MGLSKAELCEGTIAASVVVPEIHSEEPLQQYQAQISNESHGYIGIISVFHSAHKQLKVQTNHSLLFSLFFNVRATFT